MMIPNSKYQIPNTKFPSAIGAFNLNNREALTEAKNITYRGNRSLSLEKFLLPHMAIFSKLGKYQSTALLLTRVGVGAMMFMHGYKKILGGPERWTKLGGNMQHFGVNFYPEIWGFTAALSETLGAIFIVIGFFFRPSAFLIMCTMIVATVSVMSKNPFMDASESLELAFVFLGLFILGPGRYSVDKS